MTVTDFFKKIFSNILIGNCLGVIIVTFILTISALFLLDVYTRHNENIAVPNLVGMNVNEATEKLEELGLRLEVADTGYVQKSAPMSILEQAIHPNKEVKEGRIIHVTINADGPRKIAIPDVADNCSRREAEDKFQILGFKLGPIEYIVGDPDWVYGVKVNGRNVNAGTRVSVSQPITLVVGEGGMESDYNGNDSLDYILNAPIDSENEILEGETNDAPQTTPTSTTSQDSGELYDL